MFAELVPSFLTQLPRHGDLWWLGNDEITGAASPCPGFSANRKTFPPCSAFQSIQHISDGKSSIGIEIIFFSRKSCQIFYRYQHSKFFKSTCISIKSGDGKCLILLG